MFDFSYKTGSGISGLYSPFKEENIGVQFAGGLNLSSDLISGKNASVLSVNGQTLAEQSAQEITLGSLNIYLNSGDYYTKGVSNYKNVTFADNLDFNFFSEKNFFFRIKEDDREIPIGSGISQIQMQDNLSGSISSKFPERANSYTGLSSFDYYLNGQKIYSGVSGSYEISGSKFIYKENITGKIFAIPKKENIKNYTGQTPDIYGQYFVETTVYGYFNGLALDKNNWLELYTGVKYIATGIQSSIFDTPKEQEVINI
jgi:hypothetical protein